MDIPFAWHCPFCNHDSIITREKYTKFIDNSVSDGGIDGILFIDTEMITCPNPECKRYSLKITLNNGFLRSGNRHHGNEILGEWQLIPQSMAQTIPDFVPQVIIDDYNEACLICNLSPKASATLSRRCLQGIIRDVFKISKRRLIDEINEIKDKIDVPTWKAINGIRKIGNIGAHMEKEIDLIIDVDENEAEILIKLIEILIHQWYIVPHDRDKMLSRVVEISENKEELRKPAE